ncbi:MAG: hypothetical protein EZS28_023996 [Streblomastix strix]|uniref:Uncharacterized protein n=1 Tax=Streblomastix strix TaxID=222440 RepID=A0A5J4VDC7_9EUKA|nr:MAG: hypothetical protein EZS28_023996 [Streblomastix strix]
MPDEFRKIVIEQLKLAAQHKSQFIVDYSAVVLAGLAECVDNHTDIIAEIIPNTLRKYITEDEYQQIDQGMMLALNLLYYDTDEIKEKVIQGIPRERVVDFAEYEDDQHGLVSKKPQLNSKNKDLASDSILPLIVLPCFNESQVVLHRETYKDQDESSLNINHDAHVQRSLESSESMSPLIEGLVVDFQFSFKGEVV